MVRANTILPYFAYCIVSYIVIAIAIATAFAIAIEAPFEAPFMCNSPYN